MIKLYNLIQDPFAEYLPENCKFCLRSEIDALHRITCDMLEIADIYPDILWKYSDKLRNAHGEAYWYEDDNGKIQWRITYDTKEWLAMGSDGRKNTIIHEVCHLAIEKLLGHNRDPRKGEIVEDHGSQWQALMVKCGELPFYENSWCYR